MKYPIRFGKYLLLERVNVGGMAEVFKAKTFGVEGFERILAIKRILPNMSEDVEFINMFVDEARLAVQLNDANIVQIYELGRHENQYYIAMEYVAGKDLRRIVEWFRKRKQVMPVPLAAYICSKICEGLDYAHRKLDAQGNPISLVHRDVSPQNILCSFEGDVKVIDFGIAKAADRLSKTQAGVLKGKFGYMSPEQVAGMEIDRRSDLFAVGVLLYEMLTCQRLFVAETDFSTLEKVRQCEIPPMRERNESVPEELEHVVRTALAKDLNERYQWCSDFAEALQPFLITDKSFFNAKRLATFMKETFKEDIEQEMQRRKEFARITEADADAMPASGGTNVGSGTNPGGSPHGTQPLSNESTQIFDVNNDALARAATHVGTLEDLEKAEGPIGGGTKRAKADPAVMETGKLDEQKVEEVRREVRNKTATRPPGSSTNQGESTGGETRKFDPLTMSPPQQSSASKWVLIAAVMVAVVILGFAVWWTQFRSVGPDLTWVVLKIEPLGVPIEFYLDGALVIKGSTPLEKKELPSGKHELRIDAGQSYAEVVRTVEFASQKTNEVNLKLQPRPPGSVKPTAPTGAVGTAPPTTPPPNPTGATGTEAPPMPGVKKATLELEVDPPNAIVMLNGNKVGKKIENLEVGKMIVLEAKRQGYKTLRKEHTPKGDEKLALELEREGGRPTPGPRPQPSNPPPSNPPPGKAGMLAIATPGQPDTKVLVDGRDTKRCRNAR